jgi:hypothetical protein
MIPIFPGFRDIFESNAVAVVAIFLPPDISITSKIRSAHGEFGTPV